jgi:hypothetical protein
MGASETTAARDPGGAPPAAQREVKVRMYRQGLGDCFLLTFPREERPLYMLIDCGVLLGTEKQDEKMSEVARSIQETTGGQIDILVATHEHWDHLSGFLQAKEVFERITVGEVWFAWTEDPQNELANQLRRGREAALAALTDAHVRLRAAAPQGAAALQSVLDFSGPLAAAGSRRIGEALAYLRTKVAQPTYCHPGSKPIELTGVNGVKVYVLGPPQDEKLIKKSDPTKAGREVYELAASADLDRSFAVALAHRDKAPDDLDPDQRREQELSLPFDKSHHLAIEMTKAERFFQDFYYGYGEEGDQDEWSWRQIETDWLGVANDLALKLDNDTNNTSLALAIELSPGGDVLLFPGDAQVGNWLSWADLVWPKGAKPDDTGTVTAADLLARTVLYKVGHHASHNATLRAQGLELMTSNHLVAMIPVNEEKAKQKAWKMPFEPLLRRLEQTTRGRVIRADRKAADLSAGPKPDQVTDDEWRTFCNRLGADQRDELFLEYRIPISAEVGSAS